MVPPIENMSIWILLGFAIVIFCVLVIFAGFALTTCVVEACAVTLPDAGRRFKTAVASTIWGFMLLLLTFSA